MSETAKQAYLDQRVNRMRHLAETNPDVYRFAFVWLSGAGGINKELGKHLDKAVDYVERTYPL